MLACVAMFWWAQNSQQNVTFYVQILAEIRNRLSPGSFLLALPVVELCWVIWGDVLSETHITHAFTVLCPLCAVRQFVEVIFCLA